MQICRFVYFAIMARAFNPEDAAEADRRNLYPPNPEVTKSLGAVTYSIQIFSEDRWKTVGTISMLPGVEFEKIADFPTRYVDDAGGVAWEG